MAQAVLHVLGELVGGVGAPFADCGISGYIARIFPPGRESTRARSRRGRCRYSPCCRCAAPACPAGRRCSGSAGRATRPARRNRSWPGSTGWPHWRRSRPAGIFSTQLHPGCTRCPCCPSASTCCERQDAAAACLPRVEMVVTSSGCRRWSPLRSIHTVSGDRQPFRMRLVQGRRDYRRPDFPRAETDRPRSGRPRADWHPR